MSNTTIDRKEVIQRLESLSSPNVPYGELHKMALEFLKEQEPRIITEEDFENSAIASDAGEIPCWVESREFDETFPCIILRDNFAEDHTGERYWTSRPTNEQRRAAKWK